MTILGTIDNCKKAESLISAKLRASYESDMNQFMQTPVPPGVCAHLLLATISLTHLPFLRLRAMGHLHTAP